MKISFFVAAAVLSLTLVSSLPLVRRYSTRQEQEAFLKEHSFYDKCSVDWEEDFDNDFLDSEVENKNDGSFKGDSDGTEENVEAACPVDPEDRAFCAAVICFQKEFRLRQTGVVNEETREAMENLGNDSNGDSLSRRKRYVTSTRWNKPEVTYFIKNYDVNRNESKLTDQIIRSELQAAIKLWTDASSLNVTELNSTNADIIIGFFPDDHGDARFTGRQLAHTYQPGGRGISGDLHFRASTKFTANTNDGVNLRYIMVHEFGHAIGIEHSNAPGAVMNPVRRPYDPNQKLSDDDIEAVQHLYGAPANH